MKILLTGGAGFIGSHTCVELVSAGHEPVIVDNLYNASPKVLERLKVITGREIPFYEADVSDEKAMNAIFEKERFDAVIHFAANSQVGESMVNPLKYYDNNLGGTRTMLQSMIEHGVKYIVFSSTAATYGEPERVPILETDPTHPTNCYGETKRVMERMMCWTAAATGLRYAALRYFNACGAHPDGSLGEAHFPETHLIPLVLQVANGQRSEISVFGSDYPTPDGTCIRDYVHVCDLAQAHILALEYLLRGGESTAFNLGSGQGFSVREVIEEARRVTGHAIPAAEKARRSGDPARLVASSEKAQSTLGWRPRYSALSTILQTAWNWHRSHPMGF